MVTVAFPTSTHSFLSASYPKPSSIQESFPHVYNLNSCRLRQCWLHPLWGSCSSKHSILVLDSLLLFFFFWNWNGHVNTYYPKNKVFGHEKWQGSQVLSFLQHVLWQQYWKHERRLNAQDDALLRQIRREELEFRVYEVCRFSTSRCVSVKMLYSSYLKAHFKQVSITCI